MTAEPHAVSAGLGRDLVRLVRSLILTGEIKPGEKILPRDIQARFGVSHIPVREALRALEAEGLVVTCRDAARRRRMSRWRSCARSMPCGGYSNRH